jgi:hypothetical protein
MEWVVALVAALAAGLVILLKGIFGTDKPKTTKVEHNEPHLPVEGKSDREKLEDLGL